MIVLEQAPEGPMLREGTDFRDQGELAGLETGPPGVLMSPLGVRLTTMALDDWQMFGMVGPPALAEVLERYPAWRVALWLHACEAAFVPVRAH